MILFFIDEEIRSQCPQLVIGWYEYRTEVTFSTDELWQEIGRVCAEIKNQYSLLHLPELSEIAEGRKLYKQCGKDPGRYRVSSEALLRRIIQGKALSRVNNIVDLNNLISIRYRLPVCSYDRKQLSGSIIFRVGKAGETFKGIRKEMINLEGLPVFADDISPFGSPTHDSERTMITQNSRHILTKIISFAGQPPLEAAMQGLKFFLEKGICADIIDSQIIK